MKGPTPRRLKKYVGKCLGLKSYLQCPGDGRTQGRIPATALLWGLIMGVLLRRAAFAGIGANHTAPHFVRAVLEGVAYSLEDTFTLFAELGIPVSGIRLGGGGARGPLWRKIQAGIYGHAVEVLTAEEGGAFGSALMAGVGAGHWANLDQACGQAIKVAQRIEPDAADIAAYKLGYAKWRKLYPALKTLR